MTRLRRGRPLTAGLGIAVILFAFGCARRDVYAVTRQRTTDDTSSGLSDSTSSSSELTLTSDGKTGNTSETEQITDAPASDTTSENNERSSGATGVDAGPPSDTQSDGSTDDGCPLVSLTPGDLGVTVAVGSLERKYVLHVPPTYDASRPAPLIIDFHGAGGSGWDQLETSPYPEVTDADGVIMAFPDGVEGPIGAAWNVGPCCVPGVDDLAFVDALLADVKQRVCVDSRRVYAVGVLTGGGMAHYLACERASEFAAVAPAAFDLAEETVSSCAPSASVGVVTFRGTADPRVPYEGGSSMLVPNMSLTFLGAEASFRRWASINECQGEPSAPDANGCAAFTDCAGGVEVVLCSKDNGGAEPGDAAIAWPILERHRR